MNIRDGFELLATAPDGVARLRELILSLAVQGKLVAQDSTDEPASVLLEKALANKERLIAEGSIRRDRVLPVISETEIPFPVPAGWEWIRLGTIGQIVGGGTPKSDVPEYWANGDVPWLTPADLYGFDGKRICSGRRNISRRGLADSSAQLLPAGAVLFSSRAPIGYVAIAGNALATNQGFKSCVPYLDGLSDFLYWFLKSAAKSIDEAASGTTFKEISGGDFSKVLAPLPPLAEQARIVAKVDELMQLCDELEARGRLEAGQHARLTATLFDALAASESSHALAENWARVAAHFDLLLDRPEAVDALEKTILELAVRGLLLPIDERNGTTSLLDETTTATSVEQADGATDESLNVAPYEIPSSWSWIRFGEIMRDLRYGTSAKCDYEVKGIPVLRIPNLKNGRISTDDLKFGALTPEEAARLALVPGDLLLIRSNGSATLVGSAALVGEACRDFAFAGYLMRIRLREDVALPTYILLALETEGVRTLIEGPIRTTSGVKNINSTEVSRLQFPLPPLETQRRIVDRVDDLRRLCADLRERLSARQTCQTHFAEALVGQAASTAPLVAHTDDLAAAA